MTISGILKQTKTIKIQGITFTVKKYPLSFKEFCDLKALEGKSFKTDAKGNIKTISGVGTYDLDFISDKLFYGLSSWEIADDSSHIIDLTKDNCYSLALEYPDFAQDIINEITAFNSPLSTDEKKSLS